MTSSHNVYTSDWFCFSEEPQQIHRFRMKWKCFEDVQVGNINLFGIMGTKICHGSEDEARK